MKNVIIMLLLAVSSCNESKKRPEDFQFQLIYDVDSYDSESGKFIRSFISIEPRVDTAIVISLTENELDSVYRVISKSDFFSLPQSFECDENKEYTVTIPSFDTTIIVKSNGKTKKVTYNSGCSPKSNLDSEQRFKIIEDTIREFLYRKSSIKNLPETKIVFL